VKEVEIGGYVARIGKMRNMNTVLVVNSEGRDLFGDLDVDGGIIFKSILMKECVKFRAEFLWFRTRSSGEFWCVRIS
jgi:hypothetical protein